MTSNPFIERLQGGKAQSEADIQADISGLLIAGGLNLGKDELVYRELPTGSGKRIDVEIGATVIEVKKKLANGNPLPKQLEQLEQYVRERTDETGAVYAGILTDGVWWKLYQATVNGLVPVSDYHLRRDDDGKELLVWLEGVLATATNIKPSPDEIEKRLGATSSSFALNYAGLSELYELHRDDPEVQIKRELWARLLSSALGTHFEESDRLFVLHTYLVMSAELIAHAALGLPIVNKDPESLLSGRFFRERELFGVVEADFFDWPAQVEDGEAYVRSLARRVDRFDWSAVEHDVLKVLYESVIDEETRKNLGEYYTPDWLADAIVRDRYDDPLNQTILDPACGSGTFLFWAVRRHLAAAEESSMDPDEALSSVVRAVSGMDLHPVAVALARVTYVLAIQQMLVRGTEGRSGLTIPVFLGDSLRWQENEDLLGGDDLSVRISEDQEERIRFPADLASDAETFDELVSTLATRSAERKPGEKVPSITALLNKLKIPKQYSEAVRLAFAQLCELHDTGRNHIWGYYIRNLARPLWFMRGENRVDILVGNPPWLAYRFMSAEMQEKYTKLSKERDLWAGKKMATQQDLSDLFVVRTSENFLKDGGKVGFVMPRSVLSRSQYDGFRNGPYRTSGLQWKFQFEPSWDLGQVRPHIFPVPSAVVFASKEKSGVGLSGTAKVFAGKLRATDESWAEAEKDLTVSESHIDAITGDAANFSEYGNLFRQGATLVPVVLVRVREVPSTDKLGKVKGLTRVESDRSNLEKAPWKNVESLRGPIEEKYLHECILGVSIIQFGLLDSVKVIVPGTNGKLLQPGSPAMEKSPHLASWWKKAQAIWEEQGNNSGMTLTDRVDFHGELSAQFPTPKARVVYTASGTRIAAAVISNDAVIDSTAYWMPSESATEAHYLCAILNSEVMHARTQGLTSQGLFGQRHIHKVPFADSLPKFDADNDLHVAISKGGKNAERMISELGIDPSASYRRVRPLVHRTLAESTAWHALEVLVADLLGEEVPG